MIMHSHGFRDLAAVGAVAFLFILSPAQAQTPFSWTTLSGVPGSPGTNDGAAAKMNQPAGVCVDTDGTVYVAEFSNHVIRKVTPGGVATVFAGQIGVAGSNDGTGTAAQFDRPTGIAIDPAGMIYVADTGNHTIRKITTQGVVTTFAGSPDVSGFAGGLGSAARFAFPNGLALGPDGTIFVADTYNHAIRDITPQGLVSTYAGFPTPGSTNGPLGQARFNLPSGIACSGGEIMIADYGNHTIRRIMVGGFQVDTPAGAVGQTGNADGIGPSARFNGPYGITAGATGSHTFFVTCNAGHTVRRLRTDQSADITVSTVGGTGGIFGNGNGDGAAARFNAPIGIAASPGGVLYVADFGNHRLSIGRVKPMPGEYSWSVRAGAGGAGVSDGLVTRAQFSIPAGLASDSFGNLFVADAGSHTIRKISRSGDVTTVAGSFGYTGSNDGTGADARFSSPVFLAMDKTGTMFVTDSANHIIRQISPGGVVTTLAGSPGLAGSQDGTGAAARFDTPSGIALLPDGSLAVSDKLTVVRKVTRGGVVTTLAGVSGQMSHADGTGTAARFNNIIGIVSDKAGNLYVCESDGPTIRKILPSGSALTIAGFPGQSGSADGTGISARFTRPTGIAIDEGGVLYVGETVGGLIRKVSTAGVVTTIGGQFKVDGPFGGPGTSSCFSGPVGITVDRHGVIYMSEYSNLIFMGSRAGSSLLRAPDGAANMVFGVDAFSGYDLQRSTSLSGSWTSLGTYVAEPNGSIRYTDVSPPAGGKAFYRLNTLFTR